jgi:hypothetical protein
MVATTPTIKPTCASIIFPFPFIVDEPFKPPAKFANEIFESPFTALKVAISPLIIGSIHAIGG